MKTLLYFLIEIFTIFFLLLIIRKAEIRIFVKNLKGSAVNSDELKSRIAIITNFAIIYVIIRFIFYIVLFFID